MREDFKARKLAALRASYGLDQEALARETGLSRPTIQRLESGKTKTPGIDTVCSLAEFFGVEEMVFFSDKEIVLK